MTGEKKTGEQKVTGGKKKEGKKGGEKRGKKRGEKKREKKEDLWAYSSPRDTLVIS